MSITRAFTKRTKHPDLPELVPARFASVKKSSSAMSRSNTVSSKQISSPVALISTTNMLSYNAPSVTVAQNSSQHSSQQHSSQHSSIHSRSTTLSNRSLSNASSNIPDLIPDSSSVESSPTSPAPNHLSTYFNNPSPTISKTDLSSSELPAPEIAPAIPARALSHSKRAHEQVARKRSLVSRNFSTRRHGEAKSKNKGGAITEERSAYLDITSEPRTREERSSFEIMAGGVGPGTPVSPKPLSTSTMSSLPSHPFGHELEQLNEVAEEFGGTIHEASMEEDLAFMRDNGLILLSAADYLADIQPLFSKAFERAPPTAYHFEPQTWI